MKVNINSVFHNVIIVEIGRGIVACPLRGQHENGNLSVLPELFLFIFANMHGRPNTKCDSLIENFKYKMKGTGIGFHVDIIEFSEL